MEVINVKRAPELRLTDAFTSSAFGAALLAQANTQTRSVSFLFFFSFFFRFFLFFFFHWKWTKLVRLEVSGDNAAEQRLPFSISTVSTQEMSLRERSAS